MFACSLPFYGARIFWRRLSISSFPIGKVYDVQMLFFSLSSSSLLSCFFVSLNSSQLKGSSMFLHTTSKAIAGGKIGSLQTAGSQTVGSQKSNSQKYVGKL